MKSVKAIAIAVVLANVFSTTAAAEAVKIQTQQAAVKIKLPQKGSKFALSEYKKVAYQQQQEKQQQQNLNAVIAQQNKIITEQRALIAQQREANIRAQQRAFLAAKNAGAVVVKRAPVEEGKPSDPLADWLFINGF